MPSTVDLNDLDMWARAVPYDEFARLRREAPVAWSPGDGAGSGGPRFRRPAPDVADLVQFAVEAERAGLDAVMVASTSSSGRPLTRPGSRILPAAGGATGGVRRALTEP